MIAIIEMNKPAAPRRTAIHNILQWMLILISVVALPSCMSYMPYSKRLPPEIELNSAAAPRAALVSRFDISRLDFNQNKKNQAFAHGANHLLESLESKLNRDGRIRVARVDSIISGELWFSDPPRMDSGLVVSLCRAQSATHLLALESFYANLYQERVEVEKGPGGKSKTAFYNLELTAGIALYDATGAVVYRKPLAREMFYESRPVESGLLAIGPSMGNAGTQVNRLAEELAEDLLVKFYPSHVVVDGFYYTGKAFAAVTPHIINQNWDKAIELLLPLTKAKKKKTAGRAAYNLYFVYDFMGDREQAEYWHGEAKRLLGHSIPFGFMESPALFHPYPPGVFDGGEVGYLKN